MLWTLIRSGALTQSSVLFWDEPEANLNPGLVALVAEVICRMAAGGAQVHVATHSYAMIRELEFQATDHGADLSLFALERTASDGVVARPARRFAELTPNPILDAHERIYERTIRDALSG
jgi:predicted ATP-dependent endonuclease of OLD family